MKLALSLVFWLSFLATVHSDIWRAIRAPSVFRSDEVDLQKYSAILAATEPFRVSCFESVKRSINPLSKFANQLIG
jgi:hypothetical protein